MTAFRIGCLLLVLTGCVVPGPEVPDDIRLAAEANVRGIAALEVGMTREEVAGLLARDPTPSPQWLASFSGSDLEHPACGKAR